MFCENCGSKIDEKDKFCIKCGARISYIEQHNNIAKNTSNKHSTSNVNENQTNNNSNSKKIIIGICIFVLVLFISGIIIFNLIKNNATNFINGTLDSIQQFTTDEDNNTVNINDIITSKNMIANFNNNIIVKYNITDDYTISLLTKTRKEYSKGENEITLSVEWEDIESYLDYLNNIPSVYSGKNYYNSQISDAKEIKVGSRKYWYREFSYDYIEEDYKCETFRIYACTELEDDYMYIVEIESEKAIDINEFKNFFDINVNYLNNK